MTGLIVKALFVTNSTEPMNLVIGPFMYLYVKRSLKEKGSSKELGHFILPLLYLGYMFFDYVQSNEFKYNSYVNSYHPDWQLLTVKTTIPSDPLEIKGYLNLITAIQILAYIILSLLKIVKRAGMAGDSIINTDDDTLKSLRNTITHIFIIVVIFIAVKLNFRGDLGDYFIGIYVSVFAILTTIRVMNDSAYFDRTVSFIDIRPAKYRKSSLNDESRKAIITKILNELGENEYFTDNLASLSELSKRIGESQHHVSQVINESLGKNFFELLASFRIEKAKGILSGDKDNKLTIEEISEMVGYNSKTAFNNAFKKITGHTPSEYRNR